jgi:hypothetical protein
MAMETYLAILSDHEALAWVLTRQMMAFSARKRPGITDLRRADELLLYTTRNCFHNPPRDRGMVIGRARIGSEVRPLEEPVQLAGRTFSRACSFELLSLAPRGVGVELSPLVPRLTVFPPQSEWKIWLRRPLLRLPAADATLLRSALEPLASAPSVSVATYLPRPPQKAA